MALKTINENGIEITISPTIADAFGKGDHADKITCAFYLGLVGRC